MKVMKFGGGCLQNGYCFSRAAEIIKASEKPCAVVVSATKGITDILVESVRKAEIGEWTSFDALEIIRTGHQALLKDAVPAGKLHDDISCVLEDKLNRLENLYLAVEFAREVSPSLRAKIISYGERLAALILSGALRAAGIISEVWESDQIGMITEEAYENAIVNLDEFRKNIAPFASRILEAKAVPVITGFFGRTPEGKISTFGRNGSDYSAAVVASVLDATSLEIWKDADGFMSADPDRVAGAIAVHRLSRLEAAELSYFGAKILHPRTFDPIFGKNITIIIRNFYKLENPGTEILAHGIETDNIVKSITSNGKIALFRIHEHGILGSLGRQLADAGIEIHAVVMSQTCVNLIVDKADVARSYEQIRVMPQGGCKNIDVKDDVELVAVVGEGMLRAPEIVTRIFSAVSKAGVDIISSGVSHVAVYFIVGRNQAAVAVTAIHDDLFSNTSRQSIFYHLPLKD